jgi:hypothetical protein
MWVPPPPNFWLPLLLLLLHLLSPLPTLLLQLLKRWRFRTSRNPGRFCRGI